MSDEPTPALPRVSVLLVDDRRENLLALEAILEPLGQTLVRAESGEEAIEAAQKERFAVVLMDIRMPGLDGFETVAILKQREGSRHVPLIFVSAAPESHYRLRSYTSGAVDYILKPIDPEALRSKVAVFVHLRQHQLALELAHAELEARVAARTAELAAANDALAREVVVRKAAEERLYDRAFHDSLTGLANRALFMIHLNRTMTLSRRRPKPGFALLMLDLDGFKPVNDSMGHLAGDTLLVMVAERIRDSVRDIDTAARLGGDEFTVLLDGVDDPTDAVRLAERVGAAISTPYEIDGKEVLTSASIGIAIMNPRYQNADELLRDADVAMYAAKEAGRGRCKVFDAAMHATVRAQDELENDLRDAVERREFRSLYQPIFDLRSGAICGFEALVRWRHPKHGLLGPARFLALAEETGLIVPIGALVLEQACRSIAAWRQAAFGEVYVSVNVSERELLQPALPETIEAVLQKSGAAPSGLRLELSEKTLLAHGAGARGTLAAITRAGVAVAIDGFGEGPSRLNDLYSLPVSTVKLHPTFVGRLASDGTELVEILITVAHRLTKRVVAKGVESAPELDLLRQLGCDEAQGYYLSRPIDASEVEAFLRSGPQVGALRT